MEMDTQGPPRPCLFCGKETSNVISSMVAVAGAPEVESQEVIKSHLKPVFIVRQMLNIPEERCAEYLSRNNGDESPASWFALCETCDPQVDQAYRVNNEIARMKERLDKMKGNMRKLIVDGQGRVSRATSKKGPDYVHRDVRNYVASQALKATVKQNVETSPQRRSARGRPKKTKPPTPEKEIEVFAGTGHKLKDDTPAAPPKEAQEATASGSASSSQNSTTAVAQQSEEKRQAAAAALARLEQQKKAEQNDKDRLVARQQALIREQARREIEAEAESNNHMDEVDASNLPGPSTSSSQQLKEPKQYAVKGVLYTCPLIGPEMSSELEIEANIKQFLREQPEEELSVTSCLMIHSCNKPTDKVKVGVETLCKYLDNIIDNPQEEKYRRIKFSNRVYQERVKWMEGAPEFLREAGFKQKTDWNDDIEDHEEYWMFKPSDDIDQDISHLMEMLDALKQTKPIKPELARNVQVLMPGEGCQKVELPPEFYQLSAAEVKREQQLKTEVAERELTLRTKAQREKEGLNEPRVYRFCVMRVRFPDGYTLQGTFWAHEKVSDLYKFVQENLMSEDLQFTLKMSWGEALQSMDSTLTESKLTPSSVVNFYVENPPPGIASGDLSYLKPETLAVVKPAS